MVINREKTCMSGLCLFMWFWDHKLNMSQVANCHLLSDEVGNLSGQSTCSPSVRSKVLILRTHIKLDTDSVPLTPVV